ncbi:hypothetical protein XENTR_v10024131 [Xenopus tropicalis]|nr:hypothetical protein XENTR_v10024131 [Xenopus tropicalis]
MSVASANSFPCTSWNTLRIKIPERGGDQGTRKRRKKMAVAWDLDSEGADKGPAGPWDFFNSVSVAIRKRCSLVCCKSSFSTRRFKVEPNPCFNNKAQSPCFLSNHTKHVQGTQGTDSRLFVC